jgi:hypothetical protein
MASGVVCGIMILAIVTPGVVGASSSRWTYSELAAEWWKWAWSISCAGDFCPNPVIDETGDYCAVGQHGDVFFLAGSFGQTVTRNCSIPEGVNIFFPVINNGIYDSPDACGQGAESYSVAEIRKMNTDLIDMAANLSATLDGRPLRMVRERSVVFGAPIPKDNIFAYWGYTPCDAGVYSPAADEGYYVLLNPLKKGKHTVHIHAEFPAFDWVLDVTYNLDVVPVKLK